MQYLALLRGINVGGNNIIKKEQLKICFESAGLENVATYIQSGNVVFDFASKNSKQLAAKIEQILLEQYQVNSKIVLVTHGQLQQIVKSAPKEFGQEPFKYCYNVIFLRSSLRSMNVIKELRVNPAVDYAAAGPSVLYFWNLLAKATQSRLNRITQSPIYPDITIRNWNTTTKLLNLMNGRGD